MSEVISMQSVKWRGSRTPRHHSHSEIAIRPSEIAIKPSEIAISAYAAAPLPQLVALDLAVQIEIDLLEDVIEHPWRAQESEGRAHACDEGGNQWPSAFSSAVSIRGAHSSAHPNETAAASSKSPQAPDWTTGVGN